MPRKPRMHKRMEPEPLTPAQQQFLELLIKLERRKRERERSKA